MDCISSPDAELSRQTYERKRLFPVLSQLLHERTEEYFLKHRPQLSWEPIGRQSLGNVCKGPSVALHPSSQVTEFTSLIIGGNRKVIGIECCHRINVSQLHINVSALLYCLCLRNTVASTCCLSTVWKPAALAWPRLPTASPEEVRAASFSSGFGQHTHSSSLLPTVGHRDREAMLWTAQRGSVPPWCPRRLSCEHMLARLLASL